MTLYSRPAFYRDLAREQLKLLDRAGPDIAEAWYGAVMQTVDFLAKHPQVGRLRTDLKHPGIRSWRVKRFKRWIIFYGVRDDSVILHRVVSGTRDLPALKY